MRTELIVAWLIILIGAVGCSAQAGASDSTESAAVREITGQDLQSNPPPNAIILDVRTPGEFRQGHVPNAVNIPHDELADRIDDLDAQPDQPIVVYCKSGVRAKMALSVLSDEGFEELLHLEGDMRGWLAAGRPTN